MNQAPILILSGTNRPNSNTLKVARAVERNYLAIGAPAELYSLTDLPPEIFTPDVYSVKPRAFQEIQQRVLASAGLHVVTPEYNGSFAGILKYFIDLLKSPESFEHRPVAFVGVAAGQWGGLRAVEQLQLIFGYRHSHIYPDRVFVPNVAGKLGADGTMTDVAINDRIARQVQGFARFSCAFPVK